MLRQVHFYGLLKLPNILKAEVVTEKESAHIKDQYINCLKCKKEKCLKIYQLWLRRGYFLPVLYENMDWDVVGIQDDIFRLS